MQMYSQHTTHKSSPKNLQKNFYPYPPKNISKKIPENFYTTTPHKNISKKIPENFCSQLRTRPVQAIRGGV
jgi:hypothetical protein